MSAMAEATPSDIPRLTVVLQDQAKDAPARDSAAHALVNVTQASPDYRGQCVAILSSTLERYQRNPIELNTSLIAPLITLKGAESATLVQQVVKAKEYEPAELGDWASISKKLGVQSKPAPVAAAQKSPAAADPASGSSSPASSASADSLKPEFFSPNPAAAAATIASAPRLSPKEKDKLRAKRKQERKAKKQNRRH